jgi:hypothetical protein
MPTQLHKNLTGADAVHQAAFIQNSDPGSVGANLLWVDTSTSPPTLKVRNTGNTAWILFATGTTGATGATGAQGPAGPGGSPGTNIVSGAAPYVCIQDQKAQNTAGGTFTSGADRTRDLNTFVANDGGLAVLASNQITLPAGTYRVMARAPARLTNQHQALLFSVTAAATVLRGSSAYASVTGDVQSDSIINGQPPSIQQTTTFELRHRATTTASTNGFGVHANFGTEVYTSIELWLEAGPPPFRGMVFPNPGLDSYAARAILMQDHQQHSLNTPPQ